MLLWQRAVLGFLVRKVIPALDIHAYGHCQLALWWSPNELPLSREAKEKLISSSSERITNDNEGNGCKNWNRAPFGPGDSGKFRILKSLCPLGSSLADGGAYTLVKQWFLLGQVMDEIPSF